METEETEKTDTGKESTAMAVESKKILSKIKANSPRTIPGLKPDLHPLPPFIAKPEWSALGDAIKEAEKPTCVEIPGNKWISLRSDGTGFSKLTKYLWKEGIFGAENADTEGEEQPKSQPRKQNGYSPEFANIMKSCCQELMSGKFSSAKCGYTQSDELTVIIPPASIVRGKQQTHAYNGRVQKLCSLAASTITARFNYEIIKLVLEHHAKNRNKEQMNDNDDGDDNPLKLLEKIAMPTFDCRVGSYDTEEEALCLIFWRAYDSGVNATSDAVFKSGIPGSKKVVGAPTDQRLLWLVKNNLLPLQAHQRDGTFFVKRKRRFDGVNQKTGQKVSYIRGKIEQVAGNVLTSYKNGTLFPPDETLEDDGNKDKTKK